MLTAASDGCVYYYSPDGQGPYCYPEDYGSACDTHDDGLEPDCAAGTTPKPSFCESRWCYVNASTCLGTNVSIARSVFASEEYFSYDTYGDVDTWSDSMVSSRHNGKHLRVGIPGLWHPFAWRMNEDGSERLPNWVSGFEGSGPRQGIHPEFLAASRTAPDSRMTGIRFRGAL